MTGDDSLRRLALEGETRRSAAAREQAEAEWIDGIRERRQVRRLGHAHLLNALAEYPRRHAFPLLSWTLAALIVCIVLWLAGEGIVGQRAASVGLGGVLVIPFLYFPVRRWIGIRELHRERGWLRGLPFPVRAYFALLCGSPSEERTATVRFDLCDEGPGEEIVRGLAGRSGGAVRVTRRRGGWEVESGTIHSFAGADTDPTNGPLLAWMRSVIAETLLPLHAEHRITSVRFRA